MTLPCERARRLLDERLDGTLDDATRLGLDAHLSECSECRAEAHAVEASVETLRASRAAAPAGWTDAILAAVDAEAASIAAGDRFHAARATLDDLHARGLRHRRLVGFLATAAAASLLVWLFLREPRRPSSELELVWNSGAASIEGRAEATPVASGQRVRLAPGEVLRSADVELAWGPGGLRVAPIDAGGAAVPRVPRVPAGPSDRPAARQPETPETPAAADAPSESETPTAPTGPAPHVRFVPVYLTQLAPTTRVERPVVLDGGPLTAALEALGQRALELGSPGRRRSRTSLRPPGPGPRPADRVDPLALGRRTPVRADADEPPARHQRRPAERTALAPGLVAARPAHRRPRRARAHGARCPR